MDEIQINGIRGGSLQNHSAISHYRWIRPNSSQSTIDTRQDVVQWMDNGRGANKAFVLDRNGNKAYCGVRQVGTTRFLQTYADGVWTDNLLSLPQC